MGANPSSKLWDVTFNPGFEIEGQWDDNMVIVHGEHGADDLVEAYGIRFFEGLDRARVLVEIFGVPRSDVLGPDA